MGAALTRLRAGNGTLATAQLCTRGAVRPQYELGATLRAGLLERNQGIAAIAVPWHACMCVVSLWLARYSAGSRASKPIASLEMPPRCAQEGSRVTGRGHTSNNREVAGQSPRRTGPRLCRGATAQTTTKRHGFKITARAGEVGVYCHWQLSGHTVERGPQ